jgi:hypothetical protein
MLNRPHQLGTCKPTEYANNSGIGGLRGEAGPSPLAFEEPETHQRRDRNEHAEAGDLELSDPEQNRVDGSSPFRCGTAGDRFRSLANQVAADSSRDQGVQP